jgi:pimeloyl-ACP methyl ester carboxylesterase
MPGMGWSNIIPGGRNTEPALRRALVHFVAMLDLEGLTLAGESMGATIALTASTELTTGYAASWPSIRTTIPRASRAPIV